MSHVLVWVDAGIVYERRLVMDFLPLKGMPLYFAETEGGADLTLEVDDIEWHEDRGYVVWAEEECADIDLLASILIKSGFTPCTRNQS